MRRGSPLRADGLSGCGSGWSAEGGGGYCGDLGGRRLAAEAAARELGAPARQIVDHLETAGPSLVAELKDELIGRLGAAAPGHELIDLGGAAPDLVAADRGAA